MSQPPPELTFESALAELEKIVNRMESGELSLEAREQVKVLEGEVLKPLTDLGNSDA